jgi:hypothetical protein
MKCHEYGPRVVQLACSEALALLANCLKVDCHLNYKKETEMTESGKAWDPGPFSILSFIFSCFTAKVQQLLLD